MNYFNQYCSNTLGGSGNQFFFGTDGKIETGRVYYRITAGGTFNYSILFSNVIDSTYSDGTVSHKNLICDSWDLISARVGHCTDVPNPEQEAPEADHWKYLTFDGKKSVTVQPGGFFASDAVPMECEKGEYLCLEISFRGEMIPCHIESILPVFRKEKDSWAYSKFLPMASMVGCDRSVKAKIGYLGDSITQGIGTVVNSYDHWNAVVSQMLGDEYAYWNLGIGFGRANDAASDGAWLYRAKQNDLVVVCYGVNDIFRITSAEQTKKDLKEIVDKLHAAGVKVLLQTVPPFDYDESHGAIWREINRYILEELSQQVEGTFDVVPVLGDENHPQKAKYGGHPDAAGCKAWAEALYPVLNKAVEQL